MHFTKNMRITQNVPLLNDFVSKTQENTTFFKIHTMIRKNDVSTQKCKDFVVF